MQNEMLLFFKAAPQILPTSAAAQSSELGRRHGDNHFVLSVVEPRLTRSTPSAPRGSLLLTLLCLQNTQQNKEPLPPLSGEDFNLQNVDVSGPAQQSGLVFGRGMIRRDEKTEEETNLS